MDENARSVPGEAVASVQYTSCNSPAFNDAVNASRFIKGFGIAGLVYSILSLFGIGLLSGAIGIGIGLFVLRYDEGVYYKALGAVVIVLAVIGWWIPFLSPMVLSCAVIVKGVIVLGVLSKEGKTDEEWRPTRTRTLVGIVSGAAGIIILITAFVLLVLWVMANLSIQK